MPSSLCQNPDTYGLIYIQTLIYTYNKNNFPNNKWTNRRPCLKQRGEERGTEDNSKKKKIKKKQHQYIVSYQEMQIKTTFDSVSSGRMFIKKQ